MTSQPLYVCQCLHSTQRHIHSLWLHPIVVIPLHPLHSWHHTPYIWHTHGSTNVISAIWPTISNTTSTVSVSSNPAYQLYHTHSLYDIIHTLRVTSYSVCMLSQQLFVTLYPSMYKFTPSIFMTSYPIGMLSPYCFHEAQRLYLTTHPPYLISQPLYMCHHTDGTHICVDVSLYQWRHPKSVSITLGTHRASYIIYIISHSHFMTSMIMFYDITNTAFMTSDLLYMTSHPLSRTSHHFMYDIISAVSDLKSTASVSSHSPYRWHHSHYMYGIISSISVTSYTLYLWHNIH